MTVLAKYLEEKKIDSIYGIAYGNSNEEITYAKNTLTLKNIYG